MNSKIVCFVLISFSLCVSGQSFYAQTGNKATTMINVESNNTTPHFYNEKLDFRTTLVDLPGAKSPESSWQTFYEIYFVGETEFDKAMQNIGKVEKLANGAERRTANPTAEDFSSKLLLASGNFNKKSLSRISDRIVEKNAIEFSKKVPNDLKTERGMIIVSYTVKIFDAELKKTIYRSSLFIQSPFIVENSEKQARSNLFLSFYITKDGELYTSSLSREKTSTSW